MKSSKTLAERLRISARKVEQARQVLGCGDEDLITEVRAGKRSINSACSLLRTKAEVSGRSLPASPVKELTKAVRLVHNITNIAKIHAPEIMAQLGRIELTMLMKLQVCRSIEKAASPPAVAMENPEVSK